MKRLILIGLCTLMMISCSSTFVDKNDYDSETFEYIADKEHKYLGNFSYKGITWGKTDFTEYQLSQKVQKEAIKTYGKNILLRNIKLKSSNKSLFAAAGLTATAGFVMGAAGTETKTVVDEYGKEKEEEELNGLGTAGAILVCASPVFLLFKTYEITADVYKIEEEYKPTYLYLTEEEQIEKSQRLYRTNLEAKQRHLEERKRVEDRIRNHEVWVGMSKTDLVQSIGEPVRAVVKDDGTETGVSVYTGRLSTIYGNSAAGISAGSSTSTTKTSRVQIYFYKDKQVYIKDDIVTEIYDIKE